MLPAENTSPTRHRMDALLDAFDREAEQRVKTKDKRTRALRAFQRSVGHDDATRVTKADVRAWKDAMLDAKKAPKTIADAGMILKAARKETGFLRWLPWVLAFTGCRIEEACGATKDHVREASGVVCLDIAPDDARSIKTAQSQRLVPIHPALVAEGFLAYVGKLPAGSPLFPDLSKGFYGGRGETATKRHGRWVRGLGIKDERIAPAHSWRHRMADQLRFLRVRKEAADAILGHDNPTNAGDGYGDGWRGRPDEVVKELAKVPAPVKPPEEER